MAWKSGRECWRGSRSRQDCGQKTCNSLQDGNSRRRGTTIKLIQHGLDAFERLFCGVPLNAAGDVGEVEPDFYAAEVGTFGADRCGDASANMAGRADVARELRMDFAELGYFIKRRFVDFFLSVEAGAHGPFVEEMEERAGFDQPNGFGVGQNIERDLGGNAAVEEFVLGSPGIAHGAVVDFLGARILFQKHGRDVVGLAGVSESEQGTRARDHTVALVLAVSGVADFFGEGVVGVLQGAHSGRMDADVQGFEAIEIARGIEKAIDGFGIAAL